MNIKILLGKKLLFVLAMGAIALAVRPLSVRADDEGAGNWIEEVRPEWTCTLFPEWQREPEPEVYIEQEVSRADLEPELQD